MGSLRKLTGLFMAAALLLSCPPALGKSVQAGLDKISLAAGSVLKVEAFYTAGEPIAAGTGFIAFDKSILVTDYRMIQNASRIVATSETGQTYTAGRVYAADSEKGITLLKLFKPSDLTPLPLMDEEVLQRGQPVTAILSYRADANAVAVGSIVALYEENGLPCIEYAAPMPMDASGGPLLNSRGEVIGCTTVTRLNGGDTHLALDIGKVKDVYWRGSNFQSITLAEYHGWTRELMDGAFIPGSLALDSAVFAGGKPVTEYQRRPPADMNGPAGYAAWNGAVLTFRGGPFRQNAACGTVVVWENRLEAVWSVPMGGLGPYHGAGYGSQPVIVKWPKEIREMMNLTEEKRTTAAMKEVIFASQDGNIYFLDLYDGKPTRKPIDIGYPMAGSVSVDPRGLPMLAAGQSTGSVGDKTEETGFYLFNLIDQKQLMFLSGRDKNADLLSGAFPGSSLTDLNSDTLFVAGENGLFYTVFLNTSFDITRAWLDITPERVSYKAKAAGRENVQTGLMGGVAMYGHYAYLAGEAGVLQCVDVNTMSPVWAVDLGGSTAALALDFDEDGTLALYTGNTVTGGGASGACTIRRLNALTGKQDWSYTAEVSPAPGETGGCMASPLVGQNDIGDMVVFTIAHTPEGGQMIAFGKKTGDIIWHRPMDHFSVSSPVAVYSEDGGAWIIAGDSGGQLQLLHGQTGAVLNTIQLEGSVTGSPAVYNNTLVVGTSGREESRIYGIGIR